jgi:superfamily II DNA or RNA helicase
MPTGSGKTGVIAALAALSSEKGAVLVISPSRSLVDQLATGIREGFWKTIKAAVEALEQIEERKHSNEQQN